jgi:LysR family transcriptional regulator, transcriptional activator of nhaA
MDWLNYHHLRYFWAVAREGSLRKASERLRVSEPSMSAQIRELEGFLGHDLFRRSGRSLVLTETGRMVFEYAGEIFSLGGDLMGAVNGLAADRPLKLNVGLADSVPKLIAHEMLKPVFHRPDPVHVVCREGKVEDLLAQMATLRLDIILADEPAPAGLSFRVFNHLLGECGVTFCAAPALAEKLRKGFPGSLDGAPAILPTQNTNLRRSLEKWFHENGLHPRVLGEFEDAAMRTVVASDGLGFTPMASAVGEEALKRAKLCPIGTIRECTDQFYAITPERRLANPGVLLITKNAQSRIFGV